MFLILLQSSGFDLEAEFSAAYRRAGVKHDVCAALMGISSQQLSQQLAKRGHLSLRRVLLLATDRDGKRVLQEFWPRVADAIGLEESGSVAQQLKTFMAEFPKLIDKFQTQMVRAELREREAAKEIA